MVYSFQFLSNILLYGCITIHLFIYLLMNFRVVPSLGLFTSKAAMNMHVQGFAWTNTFISLGKYLGVECGESLFTCLKSYHFLKLFSKMFVPFYIPTINV